MRTNILGYPRIGSHRELKKACECYWAGEISEEQLLEAGKNMRKFNWELQKSYEIDLIPSNDFSFYDQVLDQSFCLGAIPKRYEPVKGKELDLYFAMARGYQKEGKDIIAMEMTKWFDTNYHYIVPEFVKDQKFRLAYNKPLSEYLEAKEIGIETKPVIIGPVSYLLLGKEKTEGYDRRDLIDDLLPVYQGMLEEIEKAGAAWVQLDEPFLSMDIDEKTASIYRKTYEKLKESFPKLKIMICTYFEGLRNNTALAAELPSDALHIDLVRCPGQLEEVIKALPEKKELSLGIVDGRNIWKNDFSSSLLTIRKAAETLGRERIMIAASCSFLHVPYDLELETREEALGKEIKRWMSFARQKTEELSLLKELSGENPSAGALSAYEDNRQATEEKKISPFIHNENIKNRIKSIKEEDTKRISPFALRKSLQQKRLNLPSFPTTTIGSFPQTKEIRRMRAKFRKKEISDSAYTDFLKEEIQKVVKWQEEIGLDVLVHGEFERNDMVEYFGEKLSGFVFTQNGWVQSYGSRCVKPPIIYGDIERPKAMTVDWIKYTQNLTNKPVKGMLTGPVTILQWSFVRNDQPRSETCKQIGLSIRDEVHDLEREGIKVIQIDEPAIREGLPLRKADWDEYLTWAVKCFGIASCGVKDETQIHTHMCYSEFNDIIEHIAKMDADVITIECSRSQMELLDAFVRFKYPNDIGPGVYDIHSPRIPSVEEMVSLLKKAAKVISPAQLWVNPDCGLKTRKWEETKLSLKNMVEAARIMRANRDGK